MKGSIIKRKRGLRTKSLYYAKVGKKWSRGYEKKADAEEALVGLLIQHQTARGTSSVRTREGSFKVVADNWLEYIRYHVKPTTHYQYYSRLNHGDFAVLKHLGTVPIKRLSRYHIQQYVTNSLAKISPAFCKANYSVIKHVIQYALENNWLKQTPLDRPVRIPLVKKKPEIFTIGECKTLLEQLPKIPHGDYFLMLLLTGCRIGEMAALSWTGVDFENERIRIKEQYYRGKLQPTKTETSDRWVELSPEGIDVLKRQPHDYERVFSGVKGQILYRWDVQRHWKSVLKKLNIPYRNAHVLRHTNVSMRLRSGQPIEWISKQMGHSNISTTLNVYGHLLPRDSDFVRTQSTKFSELITKILKKDKKTKN